MSASKAAAGESSSSRARQDADAEQETPQTERRWVALVSKPRILADDGGERARAMTARGTNVDLDLRDPPEPSYLVLHRRIVAQQQSAYILAADRSGRLLIRVSNNNDTATDGVMYLCNTHDGRATRLPAVPYSSLRIEARPRRSIGLVANPRRRGDYLVAQLYPRPRDSLLHVDRLLCYSTETLQWSLKPLVYSTAGRIRHNPCCETGVLAHDGRLYWLALAYGVFVCDPFAATSHLRFVPLPPECEMWAVPSQIHRGYIEQRRLLAPSQDLLRYVEIWGFSYEVYVPPDVAPPSGEPQRLYVDARRPGRGGAREVEVRGQGALLRSLGARVLRRLRPAGRGGAPRRARRPRQPWRRLLPPGLQALRPGRGRQAGRLLQGLLGARRRRDHAPKLPPHHRRLGAVATLASPHRAFFAISSTRA